MPEAASSTSGQHCEQRLTRLAPLTDALRALDMVVRPVRPIELEVDRAAGCVLAEDVYAEILPSRAIALRDGYAVCAEELADAGGYAPVVLTPIPPRLQIGEEMPIGSDAVAPPDTIATKGQVAEALHPITAGDGVLSAGVDVDATKALLKSGDGLRGAAIAALRAAGVARVAVRRPTVRLLPVRDDPWLQAVADFVAQDCVAHGSAPCLERSSDLEHALAQDIADVTVIIGGSGIGARDRSVSVLACLGRVIVHGIGLMPGESSAIGVIAGRPVLIVPGRFDAGIAAWLALGRHLLRRLSAMRHGDGIGKFVLARKISSTVGVAEVIPVVRTGESVEPLAARYLSLSALTRADGWVFVPPESEGFAADAMVAVDSLP